MDSIIDSEDPSKSDKRPVVNIRQMEIDDLGLVFHLGEKLFTADKVPNLYRTWDEFEIIELFHADAEKCLVAEHDDKVIGFALGTTIEKSRSAWKYGHLVWMGVEPECQRLGAGHLLFRHMREIMLDDGVRMLMVDTAADNLPGLRFFRKMGFAHPEEHIYLSLNLSDMQRAHQARKNGRSKPGNHAR
jgi:ribosomal protein S18 acetylase RimI-like enzyme